MSGNPTTQNDQLMIVDTYVTPQWSGNAPTAPYFNRTTMLMNSFSSIPSPVEPFLYGVLQEIITSEPLDRSYFNDSPSNAERKAMFNNVLARLTDQETRLSNMISALTTFIGTLP